MSSKPERSYRVEIELGHEWRWYTEWAFLKSFRAARGVIANHRKDGEHRRMRIVRVSEAVIFEIEGKKP